MLIDDSIIDKIVEGKNVSIIFYEKESLKSSFFKLFGSNE